MDATRAVQAGPGGNDRLRARNVALLLAALMLGGCAFPLIHMEERSAPRRLTYTRARGTASEAPPTEVSRPRTASTRVQAPELGPRKSSVLDPTPRPPSPPAGKLLPEPRDQRACHAALSRAQVRFERVREQTPGVKWPVRLKGPVRGVTFAPLERSPTFAVLDCRLALRLVDWTTDLRRARVRKVEYYSMYRPGSRIGGSGAVSGHAHGMAIDAARFELDSGLEVNVLSDWDDRRRGAEPCPLRRNEANGSRVMREVTCRAAARKLFQVVLTPHYNQAHANHVHLELKPDADWYFVK